MSILARLPGKEAETKAGGDGGEEEGKAEGKRMPTMREKATMAKKKAEGKQLPTIREEATAAKKKAEGKWL
ncbi:hypothetical protein ACLB2K_073586 [Fragaria x ananassa]